MTLKIGMQHWVFEYYQVNSNDIPGMTLTYFMPRSNLVPYAFLVYYIKVGSCSQLNEYMKLYEYQRSKSFIDLDPNTSDSIFLNFFSSVTADFNISSSLRWVIQDHWSYTGPLVLWYLKTIWWMNVILWNNESVWCKLWVHNKCRSDWPIFHSLVILPDILKTIWPQNKYWSTWPIFLTSLI